jgi:hypothetical protein
MANLMAVLDRRLWPGLMVAVLVGCGLVTATADRGFARHSDTSLVMMEEDGCSWCQRWHEEIGVVYGRTPEGQLAPLRIVDVHAPVPTDLDFLKPAYFTPTFILVSDGTEIGRIQGYPGEDFFWALLGQLLAKLPSEALKAETIQ